MKFKIGDFVFYKIRTSLYDDIFQGYCTQGYCVIKEIEENKAYGYWGNTIKEALYMFKHNNEKKFRTFYGYMPFSTIKLVNRIIKPFGIVEFCKKYY